MTERSRYLLPTRRLACAAALIATVAAAPQGGIAQEQSAAAPDPAAAEAERRGSVPCLWRRLDPHFQLRLELAARSERIDLGELIAGVDPLVLQRLSVGCGFSPDAPVVGLIAQYWTVRAAEADLSAALRGVGVGAADADRALDRHAPEDARRALAVEIMERQGETAKSAIRAAIAQVGEDRGGAPVPVAAPELLARYFANRILIDGLEAGAEAPDPQPTAAAPDASTSPQAPAPASPSETLPATPPAD